MDLPDYLTRSGLSVSAHAVRAAQTSLWDVLDEARKASMPATPTALSKLYTYPVPRLSEDGTCSLPGDLAEKPYDLSDVLGGRSLHNTLSLMVLSGFLDRAVGETGLHWVGAYQAVERRSGSMLIKLASRGNPSRAEFPLTNDFARRSTNVTVALSGKAVIIADVQAHAKAGGAYYECDPAVRAEACVPVLSRAGAVVGIIDAEHHEPNAFDETRLGWLVALALELVQHLPKR